MLEKLWVQVVSADTYLCHNKSLRKGPWILILPLISHCKSKRKAIVDLRKQMLAETSVFLTWTLEVDRGLPQILRRPVAEGGFKALVSQPSSLRSLIAGGHERLSGFIFIRMWNILVFCI